MAKQPASRKSAAPKRPAKRRKGRKRAEIITASVSLALVAVLLVGVSYVWSLVSKVGYNDGVWGGYEESDDDYDPTRSNTVSSIDLPSGVMEIPKDDNVTNILLIGLDTRSNRNTGRSDTMILLSINEKTNKITMTSFLRDIWVKIPGHDDNRLNTAHNKGGPNLLMETLRVNFGITVEKFVSVNFYSFINIIDALGGIDLELTEREVEIANKYIGDMNEELFDLPRSRDRIQGGAGMKHLNGKQALGYARNRYVGSDFGRTGRQRKVLDQVFQKLKTQSALQLNNLLQEFLPQVSTNLTQGELGGLLLKAPGYLGYSLDSWSIPMDGTYKNETIHHSDVLVIDFDENIQELKRRAYDT